MTTRKVSVYLELEAAQANKSSTELANTLRHTKANIEDLGDEADSTSRDLDQLAANTDIAKHQVDDLGDKARGTAADLTLLDARIKTMRGSVHDLGLEFARALDPNVGKQFEKEKSELAKLERLRKQLTPKIDPTTFMGIDFSGMVAESRGVLIASAVGLGVAMAPVLAGIISSAVLGAIGAGGVVGGAFLAARDYRVKAAWTELGGTLLQELEPATNAFITPIINAAGQFKKAFDQADIVGTLEQAAHLTEPLTAALAGFVRELGPGLSAGVYGAAPTIRMLARELPDLGTSISYVLRGMRQVGPEASQAFGDFFDVLEQGTQDTGDLLAGLTEVYTLTRSLTQSFKDITGKDLFGDIIPTFGLIGTLGKLLEQKTIPTMTSTTSAAHEAAHAFGDIDTSLVKATPHLDWFGQALDDVVNQMHDWIDAEVDVEQSLDDLTQSFWDNGRSLDVNTNAGRNNIRALEDYRKATRNAYDAKLAETKSVEEANAVWETYRAKLQDVLTQAGYTDEKVQAMILTFLGVPPVISVEVQTPGASAALETARELRRMLYDIVAVDPGGLTQIIAAEHASRRAAGGPVLAGGRYQVNEQRPEYFIAPADGWVMPLGQAPPGGAAFGGGGGNGPMTAYISIEIGGEVVRVVRSEITTSSRNTARRVTAGLPA